MSKIILFAMILLMLLTGCTLRSEEQLLQKGETSEQSREEVQEDENVSALYGCEYKAMQTIVNLFGQIQIDSLGEYSFDYFTQTGKQNYIEYMAWASDKELLSVGIANGTTTAMAERKDEIITTTWFTYKSAEARTCFQIIFTKESDRWLIDSISLDS